MKYPIINWKTAANRCSDILEFFPLACTPLEEECTQAGKEEDSQLIECTALIHQLIRQHGQPPANADFFIVENTGHDFGIYYEVGIFYKPTGPEAEEDEPSEIFAQTLEGGGIPEHWDQQALKELRAAGHHNYQPAKVVKMKAA